MAGSFKYILVGGVVFGIMGGTIAALTLGGTDKKPASSGVTPADVPKSATAAAGRKEAEASPPKPAIDPVELQKAEAANEAGKTKLFEEDFRGASALFREAVARDANPKYFINLGTSLFQEGKFDESLVALNAVLATDPSPRQKEVAVKLAAAVVAECDKQGLPCPPPPALKTALDQVK